MLIMLFPAVHGNAGEIRNVAKDVIIVGGNSAYPPYEFLDGEDKPTGFVVELTRAIAETMGFEVVIKLGKSWAEMREELEAVYGEEYTTLLNILGQLRARMEKNAGVGKNWFDQLMLAGLLDAIRRKDAGAVKKIIHDVTGEEVHVD